MDTDQPVVPPGFKLIKSPDQAPASDVQVPPGFKLIQGGDANRVGPPEAKDMPGTVAFRARQNLAANAVAPDASASTPPVLPASTGKGIVANVGQHFNPMKIFQGMNKLIEDPAAVLAADYQGRKQVEQEAGDRLVKGDTTAGIAKHILSSVPLVGAPLNEFGNQWESGDKVGAASNAAGFVASMAAPAVAGRAGGIVAELPKGIRGAAGRAALSQYQGAMKPTLSKGVGPAQVEQAMEYGLRNRFSPSAAGREAHYAHMDDLQNAASDLIDSTGPQRQIRPDKISQYTKDLEAEYQLGGARSTTNPEDFIPDVQRVREGVLNQLRPQSVPGGAVRNMTAREAQNMKIGTARGIRESYGTDVKPATIVAKKAVVRALKDTLNDAFPELSGINAEESAGFRFEPYIERRVNSLTNAQRPSLGTAAAGAAAQAVTGSRGLSAAVGFIREIWNPTLKTQLAYALHRASKGSITIPQAEARVAAYVNALSQVVPAESGQPSENPPSQ